MLKKTFSYISVAILGFLGNSTNTQASTSEFEAFQQAEINAQIRAEEDEDKIFCGQCDDTMSEPILILEDSESENDSSPD
jgi:hypothetical protein